MGYLIRLRQKNRHLCSLFALCGGQDLAHCGLTRGAMSVQAVAAIRMYQSPQFEFVSS